jgi:2-polyprenyl-3-methyl-5-hydroxy-6-metoxy-1,4-benzoquinol methylase
MGDGKALFENAGKNTHNKVLQILKKLVPTGRVMDVPSGSGAFARRLAALGYDVIAADVVNHGNIEGVEFHTADMNQPLPFADGSMNCITCIEGIEHLERPFDFIRECKRVLIEDGCLILTTPNTSSIRSRWRYFLTGFHNKCKYMLDETAPNPLHHIGMLSFPALRYMLHTSGFEISNIETNRIKWVSWLYAPMAIVQYLLTRLIIRKAKPADINPGLSREVLSQMMTIPLFFGEAMVVAATKKPSSHEF